MCIYSNFEYLYRYRYMARLNFIIILTIRMLTVTREISNIMSGLSRTGQTMAQTVTINCRNVHWGQSDNTTWRHGRSLPAYRRWRCCGGVGTAGGRKSAILRDNFFSPKWQSDKLKMFKCILKNDFVVINSTAHLNNLILPRNLIQVIYYYVGIGCRHSEEGRKETKSYFFHIVKIVHPTCSCDTYLNSNGTTNTIL